MNKKAQSMDLLYLPQILVIGMIVFLFLTVAVNNVYPKMLASYNLTGSNMATQLAKIPSTLNIMMWGFMVVMFILFIGTALIVKFHPIYIGASILILIVSVIFAGMYGEVANAITSMNNTHIQNATLTMTSIVFVSQHIPMIVLTIGILALIFSFFMYSYGRGNPLDAVK